MFKSDWIRSLIFIFMKSPRDSFQAFIIIETNGKYLIIINLVVVVVVVVGSSDSNRVNVQYCSLIN